MRIAIDARMIDAKSMHGIARYAYNLLEHLPKNQHEFFVLVRPGQRLDVHNPNVSFRTIQVQSKWISIKEQIELPLVLWRHKIDLFHSPSFVVPFFCPCKMTLTLHDLNHVLFRENYKLAHRLYYSLIVSPKAKSVPFVLTVSAFSKQEIKTYLQKSDESIVITPNAVAPSFFPHGEAQKEQTEKKQQLKRQLSLPEKFLFSLGGEKRHKNIVPFVTAYCKSVVDLPLYIAMNANSELLEILKNSNKLDQVYFIGGLEDSALAAMLELCSLFVFPSTYEGFGIPILEALALGAAVLTSNTSAMPEVGGNLAYYMNPFDLEDMRKALENTLSLDSLNDPALKIRRIEYAKSFSFTNMAQSTLELYNRILGQV